jgi:multidrug efflux pump
MPVDGTALAEVFVPVFLVVVRSLFKSSERQKKMYAEHARAAGIDGEESHEGNPHA